MRLPTTPIGFRNDSCDHWQSIACVFWLLRPRTKPVPGAPNMFELLEKKPANGTRALRAGLICLTGWKRWMRKLAAFRIARLRSAAESTDDIPRAVLTWDEIQSHRPTGTRCQTESGENAGVYMPRFPPTH
jgi:hypothetical protein